MFSKLCERLSMKDMEMWDGREREALEISRIIGKIK
jgi:hypothetical protein